MVHNIHSTIALAKFVKLNHTTTLMSEDQVPAVRLESLANGLHAHSRKVEAMPTFVFFLHT